MKDHTCRRSIQQEMQTLCDELDNLPVKHARGETVQVAISQPFCLACARVLDPFVPIVSHHFVELIQNDTEGRAFAIPGTPWALVRRN